MQQMNKVAYAINTMHALNWWCQYKSKQTEVVNALYGWPTRMANELMVSFLVSIGWNLVS